MKKVLFIVMFFALPIQADDSRLLETTCYAEYNSAVYIDGVCSLNDNSDAEDYSFILHHEVPCDDDNTDCGYFFEIYNNYDALNIWSVNKSDDNKKSKHMQNYLGDEFKISITDENGEKKLCAKDEKSNFCFMIPPNLNKDTFINQISQLQ
tara:strand:- start:374 stop:826 length:453 start_codon:yes stop_codon:yes gene_type:complete